MPEHVSEEKLVHVVSINRNFSNTNELREHLRTELATFKGKNVVFVLPEAIFQSLHITRQEGKALAGKIGQVLAEHDRPAYAAYSVFEHHPNKPHQFSNTGYLVSPKKAYNKINWQSYAKVTTFTNENQPTTYDNTEIDRRLNAESGKIKAHWHKRAQKTPRFPRIRIAGRDVELRVCADFIEEKNTVKNIPARQRTKRAHLIIVPARSLDTLSEDLQHLRKSLTPGGLGLVVDGNYRNERLVQRMPTTNEIKMINHSGLPRHGVFRIHHR